MRNEWRTLSPESADDTRACIQLMLSSGSPETLTTTSVTSRVQVSTQYLRGLVRKTVHGMLFGTRNLTCWVVGTSRVLRVISLRYLCIITTAPVRPTWGRIGSRGRTPKTISLIPIHGPSAPSQSSLKGATEPRASTSKIPCGDQKNAHTNKKNTSRNRKCPLSSAKPHINLENLYKLYIAMRKWCDSIQPRNLLAPIARWWKLRMAHDPWTARAQSSGPAGFGSRRAPLQSNICLQPHVSGYHNYGPRLGP